MTIIAHARVPQNADLSQLATLTAFPAVRRPTEPAERARQAWEAVSTNRAATVADAATQLGVTPGEVYQLSLDHIALQTGWTAGQKRHAVTQIPGDPALCPTWCTVDHAEDGAERMHARELVDLTAPHGDDMHEERYITVEVDAYESPVLPDGIDPASIYFAMGREGAQESSATLTPELAERLAAALFEAARIARQARG